MPKKLYRREGFWRGHHASERLPFPQPDTKEWKGQSRLLDELSGLQASIQEERCGSLHRYRGFSLCRLCGKNLGNEEYELGGWLWPAGLRHYIQVHNVRPSLAFQEFVLDRYVDEGI